MTATDLEPARLVAPRAGRLLLRLTHNLFAIVLLVAASLKARSLLPPSFADRALLTWCAITVEWLLAVWLLSGIGALWANRAAVILLCVFVAVAGWRLIAGEKDCGCFGNVHVHPGLTLSFDLIGLATIGWLGRKNAQALLAESMISFGQFRANRLVYAAVLSIALPAGLLWPTATSTIGKSSPVVVLDPRSMVGKPFPLLDYMGAPAREELMHGEHTIILFSHDCETCRALLRKLEQQPRSETAAMRLIDIAQDSSPQAIHPNLQSIRLTQDIRCLTAVPLKISVKDGIVQAVELKD
jgi:hypothetical protein